MALANTPADVSLVGAVLSRRYLLNREIGRGGMGAVYAATPVTGGPPVAIKILHPHFIGVEQVMMRFVDEGRMCVRLVHPNIMRVHECLVAEDGCPYLVMDLLDGVPLSAYTRDGGRVAVSHAVPVLQGMLAGLEAAHGQGVVHRDLKPANVFLERTGGTFSVRLLDFGIAKVMDAAGGMGTRTRTGALLGTPAYMSPEQVKSAKDVDARADLWSIGVIFYEMLSGRVAFPAPTEYARLAAVISANPIPIQSIAPELAPVASFIERALEKDRDRRFQSAREMGDALTSLVPTLPQSIPPALTRSTLGDSGSQNRAPSGPSTRRKRDESAWSLVTDEMPAPSQIDVETPRPQRRSSPAEPLTAEVMVGAHSSTLASPNRVSGAPPTPRNTVPPPVLVVPEREVAAPRASMSVRPGETIAQSPIAATGMATPMVVALVAAALALGFVLGLLVGRLT